MVARTAVPWPSASRSRFALRLDAAATAISGLVLVVAPAYIADLLGVETTVTIAAIGFGFFWPSAVWMSWASSRLPITATLLLVPMVFNIAWVLVSVIVLTTSGPDIPAGGRWLIGLAAGIAAVLASVAWSAWRQLRS